jgi:hypothetical protein
MPLLALLFQSMTSDSSVATTFAQLRASDGHELRGQTPKGAFAIPGEVHIPGSYRPLMFGQQWQCIALFMAVIGSKRASALQQADGP